MSNNKLPTSSFGSLELVLDSKMKFFEQTSNYPLPGKADWDEGRSALICRCTRYGHNWVSSVRSGRYWYLQGSNQLDVSAVFRPWIDTPFSATALDDLEMRESAENPILLDDEEDKENSPPSAPVFERPTQPPAVLRSRLFELGVGKVPGYVYNKLFQ